MYGKLSNPDTQTLIVTRLQPISNQPMGRGFHIVQGGVRDLRFHRRLVRVEEL